MKRVITIARELGSGGSEIGRRLAKELGIQYYDRDLILRMAVANPKLDPAQVRRWDERVPSTFGFAQSLFDFYNKPLDEQLWQAQKNAILNMADHENCVIVGRNSEYILREFDHCLRVFIHAGVKWRARHIAQLMPELTEEQISADIHQVDRARKKNCEHYTGTVYGDARNYDLTLNTEKLGIEKAFHLVLEAAREL